LDERMHETDLPPRTFLENCAFLCIDIQESSDVRFDQPNHITAEEMPGLWKEMGFTVEDVNEANDFAAGPCSLNAARVAEACRILGLPRIFVHWGSRYEDLCDIDPEVRSLLIADGPEPGVRRYTYPPSAGERPASFLHVQNGDYVLPKTAQDAFLATPLDFMLRNLGIRKLIMIGGHTGACLGKTASTAGRLGYRTLCVEDATFNAFESNRIEKMVEHGFDFIVAARDILSWIAGNDG
jgi:nicotinamidase-related amidase